MKRILLIDIENRSAEEKEAQLYAHWTHHPIGLMYLASSCKKAFPDVEVKIIHTVTHRRPFEFIRAVIGEFCPELIGLRSMSIVRASFDEAAQLIRAQVPHVPLIAGGPYPSSSHEDLMGQDLVDLVAIGEGEETFVDVVGCLRRTGKLPTDAPGTVVKINGRIQVNPDRPLLQDLDVLPFPDYDLINLKDYEGMSNHAFQDTMISAFICSSRGCPYRCNYCHQLFGKSSRHRSPENIVAEMREHVEKRGIRDFVFVDDIFNVPKRLGKECLSLIIKELPGMKLNFPNGLRVDQMDDELLDLLEEAGTVHMALAVETATPRLQTMIGKWLKLEKAREYIYKASKRFVVCGFFMVGFPSETYEEAMETVRFAEEMDYMTQPVLSIVRVYTGTPLFEVLQPDEEQRKAIAIQEQMFLQPKLNEELLFYGDLFPEDKVPLRGKDVQRIRWEWMRRVLMNKTRIRNSQEVMRRLMSRKQIELFYRNFYNVKDSGEAAAEMLLRMT